MNEATELEQARAEYLRLSREYTERGRGEWHKAPRQNESGTKYEVWECVTPSSMERAELLPLSRAMDTYAVLLWEHNGGTFKPQGSSDDRLQRGHSGAGDDAPARRRSKSAGARVGAEVRGTA